MAFACFDCFKSFKREFVLTNGIPKKLKCPNCGGVSYNFGRHFKAPKKTDKKQWQKVKFLFDNGFRFQKIPLASGDKGIVSYPQTLAQAQEFVVKYKKYAIKKTR